MNTYWDSNVSHGPLFDGRLCVFIAVLTSLLIGTGCNISSEQDRSLMVFCAANLRLPIEELATDYSKSRDVQIELQFGGSHTLLNQIEISKTGDIFLAADSFYVDLAKERGLGSKSTQLASTSPVIVISTQVTNHLSGLDDLLRGDYRIALANPEAAAIGRSTRLALESAGKWDTLEKQVRRKGVFTPTVIGVANAVALGSVDAGIVWNSVAQNYPELTVLSDPSLSSYISVVEIIVLKSCKDSSKAADFVEFVSNQDSGWPVFQKHGFGILTADGTK